MADTIYVIEQLTPDKTDYTITGLTPNLEHALALVQRDKNCSISVWVYDEHLLQYCYKYAYNYKGEIIQDEDKY